MDYQGSVAISTIAGPHSKRIKCWGPAMYVGVASWIVADMLEVNGLPNELVIRRNVPVMFSAVQGRGSVDPHFFRPRERALPRSMALLPHHPKPLRLQAELHFLPDLHRLAVQVREHTFLVYRGLVRNDVGDVGASIDAAGVHADERPEHGEEGRLGHDAQFGEPVVR